MLIDSPTDRDFFILTPYDNQQIKSAFYGYYYSQECISIRINPNSILDKYTSGCYVNIYASEDKILVQQDYFCSFGVYIYNYKGVWAISNSFFLLVRYLSDKVNLTLNEEYDELHFGALYPPSIKETAVNEIIELAQGEYIEIDKFTGQLHIKEHIYEKSCVQLYSSDGIELLDSWHRKYISIVNGLCDFGFQITADISGRFDSRAAMSVLVKPDIYHNISFFSANDKIASHEEDFKLASEIANIYKFNISSVQESGVMISSYDAIINSLNARLYNTVQICFKNIYHIKPIFSINGNGGEGLRNYHDIDKERYINGYAPHKTLLGRRVGIKSRQSLDRSAEYVLNKYEEDMAPGQKLYIYCNMKKHFGRSNVEGLLSNLISISPMMDPMLYKFDLSKKAVGSRDALFALIFVRYLPEIAHLGFNDNRSIPNTFMEMAKEFNWLHPYTCKKVTNSLTFSILSAPPKNNLRDVPVQSPSIHLLNIFKSVSVKQYVDKNFGTGIHQHVIDHIEPNTYWGYSHVIRIMTGYLLKLVLTKKIGLGYPYWPIYICDGIAKDLHEFTPGLEMIICPAKILSNDDSIDFFEYTEQETSCTYKFHITNSPFETKLKFSANGVYCLKLLTSFSRGDQLSPFLADIFKVSLVSGDEDNDNLLIKDVYCIDNTGIKVMFSAEASEEIMVRILWAPNELWLRNYIDIIRKRCEQADIEAQRSLSPGADRASNIFNM